MKLNEIQVSDVVEYLRLEEGEYSETFIANLLDVAKNFIKAYTGLTDEETNKHDDFYIVAMVLCQDMYDNRSLYIDKNNLNKVVETILGMHSVNLL
jgi:hypothetical protein